MTLPTAATRSGPWRADALAAEGFLSGFERLSRTASLCLRAPLTFVAVPSEDGELVCMSSVGENAGTLWGEDQPITGLCREVIALGAPLLMPDLHPHRSRRGGRAGPERARACLAVPLRDEENDVYGAVAVVDTVPREWSGEETGILEALARWASVETGLRLGSGESAAPGLARGDPDDSAIGMLGALFQEAPLGFALVDQKLRLLHLSGRLAALAGIPPGEAPGGPLEDLLPALADGLEPMLRATISSGEIFQDYLLSSENPAAPGRPLEWMASSYPVRDVRGRILGAGLVLWEVSEREQNLDALRLLAEASLLLEASLDYESTLDRVAHLAVPGLADFCVVDLVAENGEVQRVSAAHADPAEAEVVEALRAVPVQTIGRDGAAKALRTGKPAVFRAPASGRTGAHSQAKASDGGDEYVGGLRRMGVRSGLHVPLITRGRTLGVISLFSKSQRRYGPPERALAEDLARRAAAAVDNARLYREAQEANQAKSDFLAVISHEFRTPLTAVIGYTDILSAGVGGTLTAQQKEQLSRIRASAWHLVQLIEEILTFARMEAGRERVTLESVELGDFVRTTAALIEPVAVTKELGFSIRTPEDPFNIATDARKLRQILFNLLSNAIKFTDAGEVSLDARLGDNALIFAVQDTGIGIAPEHHEKIFEPFWQVDQSNTRLASGTGLGLAVSRQLARLMGGDIELESAEGRGSTFTLRLPYPPRELAHLF